jgi:hypothetical protein
MKKQITAGTGTKKIGTIRCKPKTFRIFQPKQMLMITTDVLVGQANTFQTYQVPNPGNVSPCYFTIEAKSHESVGSKQRSGVLNPLFERTLRSGPQPT